MSTPLPATGRPADVAALLTPDGVLGPPDLLTVDSADSPGEQATPQAALVGASGSPSTDQQIETSWSQANPAGQASSAGSQALDLWNFDVARAELKPEHIRALEQFTAPFRLMTGLVRAVATGYASSTGANQANFVLATRRAQAVADWCDQNGLPEVVVSTGGILDGGDGESFARARSVNLTVDLPPPPPAPAPRWTMLPGTPTAPPAAAQCGTQNIIDVQVGPLPFYSLPPNGYLTGDISFTGSARFTFKDPQACFAVQQTINAMTSAGTVRLTQQISNALALRFSASRQWDKAATAGLTALVGQGPWTWEIGVQSQPDLNYLVLKSPTFSLTELLGLPPDVVNFTWDGAQVSVQIAGQFQFAGRPGPLLLETLQEWAASLGLGAADAAILVSGIGTCAAVFYLTIDAAVNADAEGLRRGGLVANRMGFAAELAVFITAGAAEQDADQFLSGWDDQHLREMRNTVDQARRMAADQLNALADQKDAEIAALRTKYAQDQSGKPLAYNAVAAALFQALGGDSSAGDVPSLGQL